MKYILWFKLVSYLKYPWAELWSNFSFSFKNVEKREGLQNSPLLAVLIWRQGYLSFYVSPSKKLQQQSHLFLLLPAERS